MPSIPPSFPSPPPHMPEAVPAVDKHTTGNIATLYSQGGDYQSHGAVQVHLLVHPRPVELHVLDHNGVL